MSAEQMGLVEETKPRSILTGPIAHLIAGTVAGIVSKVIEFPFDTVKVIIQTKQSSSVANALKGRSFISLYRGISAPIVAAMGENAIIFAVYGNSKVYLTEHAPNLSPVANSCLSGGLAGAFVSLLLTPVEFVKCNMQTVPMSQGGRLSELGELKYFFGTLTANRSSLSLLSSMYKGFTPTLARETFGGIVYFGVYEGILVRRKLTDGSNSNTDIMIAGSLAGASYWTSIYPVDSIKSRIQTSKGNIPLSKLLMPFYSFSGIRELYKGLGITLIRSVPANAAILVTYEFILKKLQN